jgi:glycine betaine transporter
MLTASMMLIVSIWLALSRFGTIKLGRSTDEPEFSTFSWLAMMFAAGMGVGLLFYGAAEPISHFLFLHQSLPIEQAASNALLLTYFHWGLHAWAIYGLTGLVIAYFMFRKQAPPLISTPVRIVFGDKPWTRTIGWIMDLLAIYAIAIGLAGSIALGVFQVEDGVASLFNIQGAGLKLGLTIFAVLCLAYTLPLLVDLSKGMGTLSNTAIIIAIGLMLFVLLVGPTHFFMRTIVEGFGVYFTQVLTQGFRTYPFFEKAVDKYFTGWTLNYMLWWLAWAPFVGVFIARISKGRTIREFILGVLLAPTIFSIFWFGIFGGMGFFQGAANQLDPTIVQTDINRTTFMLLKTMPFSRLTIAATVLAAFLFIVTSVVSAAYVLAMFSTGGDQNPPVKVKLMWGVILGALGLVMILSGSAEAVRQIIALSANPFVFITIFIVMCLLKALQNERTP